MSKILALGENLEHLPAVLTEYDNGIESVVDILRIEGKTLVYAVRENSSWQSYYDQQRVELYVIVKYMEAQVAKVRSNLFKSLNNFSQRDLSDNAKNKYIDSEPAYLTMYALLLETKEVHDKYDAICKAFQTRGYALNNITKVVVADATEYIV